MTKLVYTIAEVADMYRCSTDTIRRSIRRGELDAVKVMGVTRIPATALPATLTQPHGPESATAELSHGARRVVVESSAIGPAGSPHSSRDAAEPTTEPPGGS